MAESEDTRKDAVFELASKLRGLRVEAEVIEVRRDEMTPAHPDFQKLAQWEADLWARHSATERLVAATPAQTVKDAAVHVMMSYSHLRTIWECRKETCRDEYEEAKRMMASALALLIELTGADLTEADFECYAPPSLLGAPRSKT